jgi:hypothetical protein
MPFYESLTITIEPMRRIEMLEMLSLRATAVSEWRIVNVVKILENNWNNGRKCINENYQNKWLEYLEEMPENRISKLFYRFKSKV